MTHALEGSRPHTANGAAEGRADVTRPDRRRGRRRVRALGWAAVGAVALGVGYLPAARVPIIADDFQALQETYAVADGSLWRAVGFGVEQGTLGGHFNPVGQALGAAYHFVAYWLSATLQVSPEYYDVLVAVALLCLTVAGAASVLSWGLQPSGSSPSGYWPLFALVAVLTATTLQIHAPWSNDPVTSFGPAGWGAAALGFWAIALSLRATSPGRRGRRDVVACSLVAVACVWYYEMLVAAVAAVAVGLVLRGVVDRSSQRNLVRRRCLTLLVTAVLAPAVLFVLGRRLAVPTTGDSYGGTSVTLGPEALQTWWFGLVGALPGGGWGFLAEMAGPITLRRTVLLVAGALCLLVGGIALMWRRTTPGVSARSDRHLIVLLAVVVTYWTLSTASHSVTAKYIAEIRNPGQVYLFYAVGVVAVAMLMALGLLVLPGRLRRLLVLAALPVVGLFTVTQVAVNMAVADAVQRVYDQNRPLAALSTDGGADPDTRCEVLEAWASRPWPDYYRAAVTEDVQENYRREFGEAFCVTGVGLP